MDNKAVNVQERKQESSPNAATAVLNGAPLRARPQTLLSPTDHRNTSHLQVNTIELIIHKDTTGYGMKVSGDNPVFVEHVKPNQAAYKAGLLAGDMILKVNGEPARSKSHLEVVRLIKASEIVRLTIQRSLSHVLQQQQQQRPQSMSASMSNSPSTPIAQRSSITAPLPVDHHKRKEMEHTKIQTLRLMLDQERKNLENLLSDKKPSTSHINQAEQNIRTLEDQLKQICGEDALPFLLPAAATPMFQLSQNQNSHAPAFLSRFPRSLSSLSLGTKKNKPPEKMPVHSPAEGGAAAAPVNLHGRTQSVIVKHNVGAAAVASPTKKQKRAMEKAKSEDVPPPLPQRNNVGRKSVPTSPEITMVDGCKIQVSDLDKSSSYKLNVTLPESSASPTTAFSGGGGGASGRSKRSKGKKAHSDPKMSTQMFIQMEARNCMSDGAEPPPLPPRQPSLAEPVQCVKSVNSNGTTDINGRYLPNSINTLMNYPLVTTCTAVRDNFSAFPLSHRPNIKQQLQQNFQQQQQQQQHKSGAHQQQEARNNRRKMTSPDSIDSKRLSKDHSTDSSTKQSPSDDRSKLEDTPPGTPPPPYLSQSMIHTHSQHSNNASLDLGLSPPRSHPNSPVFMGSGENTQTHTQKPIISMEDDETSDQEFIIEEGPFSSLKQLLDQQNLAYLAVFLNYVLLNSDPSALLFYLITGLYKEGNVKDMRKWAYEIHSTFLVPRAPLLWSSIDETMAREVDVVLQHEFDKQEFLRKVFWKTRVNAKAFVNQQLQEFQDKRIAGLQTMFGPSDTTLMEAKGDKAKEQKIVEDLLIPKLQQYLDEVEKEVPAEDPKKIALCYALSTVLHRIFVIKSNPGGPIEKVATHFVSREKSLKKLMGKTRGKVTIKGHQLALHQYYDVAICNHCQNIIWGLSPQGYQCENCELNLHRNCSKALEETCPGPLQRKHGENKISRLMEKIRTTHHFTQPERKTGRHDEDDGGDTFEIEQRPTTSIMRHPSDRRTGESLNNVTFAAPSDACDLNSSGASALFTVETRSQNRRRDSCKSKSAPVSVSRSESYKERSQRKNQREKRKTSDPSLGKDIDESVEPQFTTSSFKKHPTVEGSSNSSLSSNMDSPSLSCEAITEVTTPANLSMHSKSSSIGGTSVMMRELFDEEDDDDDMETDWSSKIDPEFLASMSDVEKKRQEIINEIYITERNHVRNLRLLNEIFMRPLQTSGLITSDNLNILFPPSMASLQDLHGSFEYSIKQRRQEHDYVVQDIGDVLLELFGSNSADELKTNAALFCARQQIALDILRDLRKKNDNLHRFLQSAEANKACRRLQLKDLLPTVLQRLTKYPLLFDSLHKVTLKLDTVDEREASAITKALESSRDILNHVNQEVKTAEDMHKLQMIQKKLDRSNYEKEAEKEFKNLDLTQHKLIHDGPLCLKRSTNIQMHGFLFESMMVLLQKQDDKYILKFHPVGEKSDVKFNPVFKINFIIVRQSATEKNSLFLINTSPSQMLELVAPSSSECKNWFRQISDASEAYKKRLKETMEETVPKDPKESLEVVSETNPAENTENIERPNETVENDQLLPELTDENKEEDNNNDDGDDVDDDNDDEEDEGTDESEQRQQHHEAIINNSRRLTQQSSLIAPTEIHVTTNEVMVADRVINSELRLKRLDQELRSILLRKQEIVCDMFNVPYNDFQVIVDIAGQNEAPKEPTDLLLAAFAQIQSLTEVVNDSIATNTYREVAAKTNAALCDTCLRSQVAMKNGRNAAMSHAAAAAVQTTPSNDAAARAIEDEDGYCEIEEIRHEILHNNLDGSRLNVSNDGSVLDSSLQESSTHVVDQLGATPATHPIMSPGSEGIISGASNNINEIRTCKSNCYNPLVIQPPSSVSCNLISGHLTALSTYFSHLMPIINQREKDRDLMRRENQHLREMLNLLNEGVSEREETPVDDPEFVKIDDSDKSEKKDIDIEVLEKETFEDAKEVLSPTEEEIPTELDEPAPGTNQDTTVDEVDTVAPEVTTQQSSDETECVDVPSSEEVPTVPEPAATVVPE